MADGRPEIYWRPVDRDNSFLMWRGRIALLPGQADSPVVIGGGLAQAQAEGALLFRRDHGDFVPLVPFPHRTERSFVLDFDRHGDLWLAPFRLSDQETYEGLRILRRTGGTFLEEIVRPGMWPQAIDIVDENEGYIAGNHGRFLKLENGTWRSETLEGPPGRWQDHNFLALKLLPGGDGWAVGKPGLVARRQGGRFRVVAVPPELAETELTDLALDPAGRLFIATYGGEIARFDGHDWQITQVADSPLMGIELVGENDGWAVGSQGLLLRFDGSRWTRQTSPVPVGLHDVAMLSPSRGYIAGSSTVLEATTEKPLFVEAEGTGLYPMVGQRARLALAADLDLDGDLDVVLTSDQDARLYENLGQGFAPGQALAFAAPTARARLISIAVGETNGDGRPDLLATFNPVGASLLVQQADLAFRESTVEAGIAGIDTGSEGNVEFVDFDLDGDLDLYFSRYLDSRGTLNADLAFANNGHGQFSLLPYDGGGKGVERLALWGDLDGDRRPDLVLPENGRLFSSLLLDPLGVDSAGSLHRDLGLDGIPPGLYNQGNLADFDQDGLLDLLLFGAEGHWLRGLGGGRFAPPQEPFAGPPPDSQLAARLSAVADLDLDGQPEVLVTRYRDGQAALRVYRRDEQGLYQDVALAWGLADLRGESLLPFDFDRDGDLDLLVADVEGVRLLINQFQEGKAQKDYLAVELRGIPGNPSAIGAELRLYADAGARQGELLQFQVSSLGDGPGGRRPAGHFVFPAGERPLRLEVLFPSGDRQELKHLRGGRVEVWERGAHGRESARNLTPLFWRGLVWLLLSSLLAFLMGAAVRRRRRLTRPAVDAPSGQICIGPYTCLERIGCGGAGEVYRAKGPQGAEVAVKLLHPHLARDGETRLRFEREAELLSQLHHPGLLRLFGRGEHLGSPYLVTELLEGRTLRQWLDLHGAQPRLALEIAGVLAEILAYLHGMDLVHRDLKSDNVFVLDGQPSPRVDLPWHRRIRLLDLGLVRGGPLATLTRAGESVGTLAYMAPEQLRGEKAGRAADLWALGLLLAEVYGGQRPTLSPEGELGGFLTAPGQPPSEERLRALFPPQWLRLLRGLLGDDPAHRFAELGEVLAELATLLERENEGERVRINGP